jgi:hypothetical protein
MTCGKRGTGMRTLDGKKRESDKTLRFGVGFLDGCFRSARAVVGGGRTWNGRLCTKRRTESDFPLCAGRAARALGRG